jgi:hypothetical protein
MDGVCSCSTHGEVRKSYKILVGNPEGKRLLQRPMHRWEYNIKVDLNGTGCVWTGFMWLRIGSVGVLL